MSGGFVADASVGIAWTAFAQSSTATEDLLDDIAGGREFVVPVLWLLEVANGLLTLARRKQLTPEQWLRARRALGALSPITDEEAPRRALAEIADLAGGHHLSVYDATYLELAIRRRLPLASRDAALNRAAKAAGVRTLV